MGYGSLSFFFNFSLFLFIEKKKEAMRGKRNMSRLVYVLLFLSFAFHWCVHVVEHVVETEKKNSEKKDKMYQLKN